MSRSQPPAPITVHDETSDHIPVPCPNDKHLPPPKYPPDFEEDRLGNDLLELVVIRFQNLMKNLNRTPIREQQIQAIKRITRIKKQKNDEPGHKKERKRQIEIPKPSKKLEAEQSQIEPVEGDDIKDLFQRISELNRGKNRAGGIWEIERGVKFSTFQSHERLV